MHLELVELLRCPVAHGPSVLVASADKISNRYVTEGLLGCPECHAEYSIRGGITRFTDARTLGDYACAVNVPANPIVAEPMRLAAQLGLNAGRTVFVNSCVKAWRRSSR